MGLGIGFGIEQREQLKSIGTDIAICFPGKTGMPSGGYAAGQVILFGAHAAQKLFNGFPPLGETVEIEAIMLGRLR